MEVYKVLTTMLLALLDLDMSQDKLDIHFVKKNYNVMETYHNHCKIGEVKVLRILSENQQTNVG